VRRVCEVSSAPCGRLLSRGAAGKGLVLVAVFLLVGMWGCGRGAAFEGLSELGKEILGEAPQSWSHLEGKFLMVHAQSAETLKRAAEWSDAAYRALGEQLDLSPVAEKAHLFIVEDEATWEAALRRTGLRPDGLALHLHNEVYVSGRGTDARLKVQLAHEIVHLRLWQHYGERLPLWLEEGLALHLGWRMARTYHAADARTLSRSARAVAEREFIPVERLVRRTTYPEESAAARAFYREAEELVRLLHEELGDEGLSLYVRRMAENPPGWRRVLQQSFSWSEERIQSLAEQVRARSLRRMATASGFW